MPVLLPGRFSLRCFKCKQGIKWCRNMSRAFFGSYTTMTRARGSARDRGALCHHHGLAIIITALLGVTLSLVGSYATFHWADRAAEVEFVARANNIAFTLQTGMNEYFNKIAALRALFKSSEQTVSRAEFATFTQDLLKGQTAILSVSWIPRVRRDERAANEIAAARDGIPGYRVKAVVANGALVTAPERNEYFPVYFTTDKQNADFILGLDLADGGVREDVLKRARDSNELSVSKLTVLHSGTGNRRGFFVLSPVYKKGLPHQTVEERRRNLDGFVQGVFQLNSMVETILTPLKTSFGYLHF